MRALKGNIATKFGEPPYLAAGGEQGYMWDNPVARVYRDARLVSIGGGADEIMLSIIARGMGTLPG